MAGGGTRITFNDKDLQKRLDVLVKRFDKKTKKAILRKGAVIVAKELKQQTPTDTGSLKKTVKPMTWSGTEDYFASFSAKTLVYNPDKQQALDPFFAAFLNEGWVHHFVPYKGSVKSDSEELGAQAQKITRHKNFIEKATLSASPEVVRKIESEVVRIISAP